ncbi:hypothetical protein [Microbacterium hydrocarbonoxydans]|jgi:hypothetical protein|uniref:hypothetical protein n=1 Tax=Microbacterium hydrocarbonoxydans TaxID=273678 RepID=UPI00178ABA8D
MTGGVWYDPMATAILIPRWGTQASQLRAAAEGLSSASTGGLPSVAQGPSRVFLEMWETTERRASVASDVYADELRSTHGAYTSFDDEIARRMEQLEAR